MPPSNPQPRQYQGVMVSSTFNDLKDHRKALLDALHDENLLAKGMEQDSALIELDKIESSLQKVRDASAYVSIISKRYGQIEKSPDRNPSDLSLTELEFNEALRLERPILLFIMGDAHPGLETDFETNRAKKKKLIAFRERAKKMGPDLQTHRIYDTFNNLEDFRKLAIRAAANLSRFLDKQAAALTIPTVPTPILVTPPPQPPAPTSIPHPPTFYAEPNYAASHKFVGRHAELNTLNDWAAPADPYPMLLFDAIGGSGKSMLTWEWTTRHATQTRADWAGRLWYSFYERGAIMADFCRHALAYITREPLDTFKKLKPPELSRQLLVHLQGRPWLLVLDGLERVLVAYNRNDAAELSDEEASRPTDQIANRDPCAAIRPEDDDLLRALAAAAPSKILVTTRLPPRTLLNTADQPVPGVSRVQLRGLRPPDAEALLRSAGVRGESQAIQAYLQTNCGCHPLTTGILAGLIQHYLPDRGNFDAWEADPEYGGQLNFAELDLIQKRNHILKAAIAGLPKESRQLLSLLALLSEGIDFPTLRALNPHLPAEPEKVEKPFEPWGLSSFSSEQEDLFNEQEKQEQQEYKAALLSQEEEEQREYQVALQRWKEYEKGIESWHRSPEHKAARRQLDKSVQDLQSRGLLQYDNLTKRYDLHPVVRGVTAAGLPPEEKITYGQRVVDHFSAKAHSPYEQAETLDDLSGGLHIVRTLLKMGRYQQAAEAYEGDLRSALFLNLEAYAEIISLLKSFFPDGWAVLPRFVDEDNASYLSHEAGIVLQSVGELKQSMDVFGALLAADLKRENWAHSERRLRSYSISLGHQNSVALETRAVLLSLDLVSLLDDVEELFCVRLDKFYQLTYIGRWAEAEETWRLLVPMNRPWSRDSYSPGSGEALYAQFRFWQGDLTEEHMNHAEHLAQEGKNRRVRRSLYALRGEWRLEQGEWELAAENLQEAVSMARAIGGTDAEAETLLALARFRLHQLLTPREEAEQLAKAKQPAHRPLAELWLAIGDLEQAKKHALEAYKNAWADGEPYVHRYELNKARALLETLGAPIPQLPPYDPATAEKLPSEDELVAAIEKLRAEKEAEAREQQAKAGGLEDHSSPDGLM